MYGSFSSFGNVVIGGNITIGGDSDSDSEVSEDKIGNFSKTNANINHSGGKVGGNFSTTNGSIRLNGSTVVRDLNVSSTNGSINLKNLKSSKEPSFTVNASATNGSITLTNIKFLNNVSTTNGSIDAENCTANNIKTSNGQVTLTDDARVKNVQCRSKNFRIDNSFITETLTASIENNGRLKIGPSSHVEKIDLKKSSSGNLHFSGGIFRGNLHFMNGNIIVGDHFNGTINGTRYVNGQPLGGSHAPVSQPVAQNVTVEIENGSTVKHIEFDTENCTVILKGNAQYTGARPNNMDIVRR